MAQRYEIVSPENVQRLNRLLDRGWTPVRETPVGGTDTRVLVLLERDGEPLTGTAGANVPLQVVGRSSLFEGLTDDELLEVVEACTVESYDAGRTVFVAGDESRALYVLLEGEVRIVFPTLPLEDMELVGFSAGSVFGESTFFSPAAHNASAECTQPARVLRLDRDVFDQMRQNGRPVALKLAANAAETLALRLQDADAWVWDLLEESQGGHVARSWHRYRDRIRGRIYGND